MGNTIRTLRRVHRPHSDATLGGELEAPTPLFTPSLPIGNMPGQAGAGRGQQGKIPLVADKRSRRGAALLRAWEVRVGGGRVIVGA
jgi:hypothetical protein